MSRNKNFILQCTGIAKKFQEKSGTIDVLKDISFAIEPSQQVAIMGASGSGKSTLLHLLAGLDSPTAGTVSIDGINIALLSEKKLNKMRNRCLGFVYQFHHLLAEFSACENVAMPLLLRREVSAQEAKAKALAMLDKVGLSMRSSHKPSELSGGERQRVAIARALVSDPKLVLMDEPTGNLDAHTAEACYQLILQLSAELTTSFVCATHDVQLANRMSHAWHLHEGRLTIDK